MKKWFATISCGNGMTKHELIEFDTYEEADSWAREDCVDFATSYGYYQDLDYFGDLDQLYREDSWCDEEEEYTDVSELDYHVCEYDPEEHEGYLL